MPTTPASASLVLPENPAAIQGGDLTAYRSGQITVDLSTCTNRLGPPPHAIAAVRRLLSERPGDLVPPPYERAQPPYVAEKRYLQAFADRLGTDVGDMLPARGVTEFLTILSRVLREEHVAVIAPDYTETMRLFPWATFVSPPDTARDTVELRLERVRMALRTDDVVILSNPSNPLGHFIPSGDLLQAARENPGAVLVVDEEYIEFQGEDLSLAGADADNLVVLQSTGKTYGMTGSRAGMLWTRNQHVRDLVAAQLIQWPLSLLDITLGVAALEDTAWLTTVRAVIQDDARRLQQVLADRFDELVVPAGIHYRFVHLADPRPVVEHLAAHGIAVRMFDGAVNGACGIRIMAPNGPAELAVFSAALDTLPAGWGRA
ncbi:aminotransferase class I/II-fold pyridoxal phosphate-dependent enzyme [Streptomyces sp. CA-251247]|uniref:aminotransferase class I/II-fold pyridoxal phosphate-dependent enzyme n=1 Tax=Streptomyces sp. CA-251247 TaxID=3240062 RepID=UPI003D93E76C